LTDGPRAQGAKRDKPCLTVFSQLAVSLVFDLGLNKPLRVSLMHSFKPFKDLPCDNTGAALPRPPTAEERRAALACFFLTSMVSISLKRIDALRWTPRLDEYLQSLAEQPECPLDLVFVAQVKLQLIMEQVNEADWQPHHGSYDNVGANSSLTALYINALRSRVEEVKLSLPADLRGHEAILGPLHETELILSESALCKPPPSAPTLAGFDRLGNLDRCVRAIASFFDFFFQIPCHEYRGLTLACFTYLAHNLVSLYALSVLDEPAWDRGAVRRTADVLAIMDRLIENMLDASQSAGLAADCDVLPKAAKIMQALREKWGGEMDSTGRRDMEEMLAPSQSASAADAFSHDLVAMGMSDEAWFRDVFIPWEDGLVR